MVEIISECDMTWNTSDQCL